MQAVLIRQARVINARLQNLRKILRTHDGLRKDAMLEAIHTANPMDRGIRTPRGLRRQTQPGSGMPPSNSSAASQAEVPKDLAQHLNGNPQHDLRVPSIVSQQPLFQPLTIADTFTDDPLKPLDNLQNRRPTDQSTKVVRDHRTPFADLLARLQLPASSR